MIYPHMISLVVTILLIVPSAFGQPPQSPSTSPVQPNAEKLEEQNAHASAGPLDNGGFLEQTPPTATGTIQDVKVGENKSDRISSTPEGAKSDLQTDEDKASTTLADTESSLNDSRAIAVRVKALEERLRQLEEPDKPKQTDRLPPNILSCVLLLAVAVGFILIVLKRPDKSLCDGMRQVGEYLRAEDKEERDSTEPVDGETPTTKDGEVEGIDELFSIIRRVGLSLLFLITFFWLLLGAIPIALSLLDTTISGTFGDTFGFVNAWFSGLALAGVILAIVMQTIELRYQRKELKHTREELTRSADAAHRSQEQFTKQTELSFLSTYLGSLEAVARMSPDVEGSPGYLRQRARLNSRLTSLLESLERDQLGVDLVARAEDDEATTIWKGWKQRFSDLYDSLKEHCATKRRNNGNAVGEAKKFLTVVDQQLNRLRNELEDGQGMQKLARTIDNLRQKVRDVGIISINESGMVINTGGNLISQQETQYQEFWERCNSTIELFRAIVESVERNSYEEPIEKPMD